MEEKLNCIECGNLSLEYTIFETYLKGESVGGDKVLNIDSHFLGTNVTYERTFAIYGKRMIVVCDECAKKKVHNFSAGTMKQKIPKAAIEIANKNSFKHYDLRIDNYDARKIELCIDPKGDEFNDLDREIKFAANKLEDISQELNKDFHPKYFTWNKDDIKLVEEVVEMLKFYDFEHIFRYIEYLDPSGTQFHSSIDFWKEVEILRGEIEIREPERSLKEKATRGKRHPLIVALRFLLPLGSISISIYAGIKGGIGAGIIVFIVAFLVTLFLAAFIFKDDNPL